MKLTFNISLVGTDVNRTLVKNLGSNIIKKLVVKLKGYEIISTDDILYSNYDCWKSIAKRCNAVFQGIVQADGQTENAINHRINTGNKASGASDGTVASIFDNKFCVLLDFEILEPSLPLYQYGLGIQLTYELTFADNPDETYTISNISLEFDTVLNALLAGEIRTEYMTEFLEPILFHSIILIQASQWISIACQKVSRVCYSFLQKKEAPLNLIEILKNSLTPR